VRRRRGRRRSGGGGGGSSSSSSSSSSSTLSTTLMMRMVMTPSSPSLPPLHQVPLHLGWGSHDLLNLGGHLPTPPPTEADKPRLV